MRFETVSQPVSVPRAISRALYFDRRRRWRPDLGTPPFMVFVKGAGFLIYLRPAVAEIKERIQNPNSGPQLGLLTSSMIQGVPHATRRRSCSSPLQRRGCPPRVKKGPASKDAGYSKSRCGTRDINSATAFQVNYFAAGRGFPAAPVAAAAAA